MADNELILLEQYIADWHKSQDEPVPDDRAFEVISATQVLHDYDVSADEIENGVIGGGNDGAVDAVYTFLGSQLLAEDSEALQDDFAANKLAIGTSLTLILVQAKRTPSFSETAVDLVSNSTARLLDLGADLDELSVLYSETIRSRIGFFRTALRKFGARHLSVRVEFVYATKGSTAGIDPKVELKARELEAQFSKVVSKATGRVAFLGASELWERVSTLPSYTLNLVCQEFTPGDSHVALVTLREYLAFLRDDQGNLRRHIFDWNVRDYQGTVAVNRDIRRSILDEKAPEFWWLNNGVTIVSSKVTITNRTFSLDDVQVVNGLQTSETIFQALNGEPDDHFALDRQILIRVLSTGDDTNTRDQVIRATNSQTSVSAASLRATDEIQRRIEAFFLAEGWYYDRRKNFYRNQGKAAARIVGIPLLAQSVTAMGFSRPDTARARPSSLLKQDSDYERVFDSKLPLPVFLWLAKTQKRVDAFLLTDAADTTASERTNLRFHLSMLSVAVRFGGRVYNTAQLSALAEGDAKLDDNLLSACLSALRPAQQLIATGVMSLGPEIGPWSANTITPISLADGAPPALAPLDKVAKGPELVTFLLEHVLPALLDDEALKRPRPEEAHSESEETGSPSQVPPPSQP